LSRSRSERTTEQRERDREERERRRAERSGVALPPGAPAPEDAPETPAAEAVPPPAAPEPEPFELPTEPLPAAAEPIETPAAVEPSEPAPAPAVPEPPPTEAFEVLLDEPPGVLQEAPEHEALEFEPYEQADAEPPEQRAEEEEVHEPAEEPRIGKPPPPISASRRRRTSRVAPVGAAARRRRGSHRARLAALIALGAALIAVVVAVVSLSSGSHPNSAALPAVVRVLIPEGQTRAQIAEIAKAKGLTGDYRKESEHSPLLDPTSYGAPKGTPDLEGFLFPATYELDKGAPALRLVEEQLAAFTEHFGPPQIARAKALHVTPYQLLTVASMVEREAQVPGDRPKIAAVIYNRLAQGIPLGIDATIYYAVELEKGIATYTHELTEAQLHIDSPYNTRIHTGLPPTPISNPGAASIEAAAHPAKVSYLYYVAGADGCGEQVFSNTQAQFEIDVAAYKNAVEKNGGHPPVCKKK